MCLIVLEILCLEVGIAAFGEKYFLPPGRVCCCIRNGVVVQELTFRFAFF